MRVERVGLDFVVESENSVLQGLALHRSSATLDQRREDPQLPPREFDPRAVHLYFLVGEVENERSGADCRAGQFNRTATDRSDAREHFVDGKGFGEVFVCPAVKARDTVIYPIEGAENDDMDPWVVKPQGRKQRQAFAVGQRPVEQDQIERSKHAGFPCRLHPVRMIHDEPLAFESLSQRFSEPRFVFDQ